MRHYSLAVVLATVLAVAVNGSEYDWYTVRESDIINTPDFGVTTTKSTHGPTTGAIIVSTLKDADINGCNNEAHVWVQISDSIQNKRDGATFRKFDKIRYTLQFWDAAACWSILGNTYYGNFGPNFETGLHEFDIYDENDIIISDTLLFGSYDGETMRCDSENDNFWYSGHLPFQGPYGPAECNVINLCYMGSLRVEQRRNENVDAFKAGPGVGFTCTGLHTTVKISEIEVGYAKL